MMGHRTARKGSPDKGLLRQRSLWAVHACPAHPVSGCCTMMMQLQYWCLLPDLQATHLSAPVWSKAIPLGGLGHGAFQADLPFTGNHPCIHVVGSCMEGSLHRADPSMRSP